MTAVETREKTRLLAGEKPKGRVALVTGSARAIGRSLASELARLGRPGGVVQFLCSDACSLITGRVWALNVRGEA